MRVLRTVELEMQLPRHVKFELSALGSTSNYQIFNKFDFFFSGARIALTLEESSNFVN
jgi:hypothetical protein